MIFLACTGSLFAQAKFNATITLDYMNVIYTTVENSITINTNAPLSDIEVKINKNGKIGNEHVKGSYAVTVKDEGNYQLTITQVSTHAAVSYLLRAKRLPPPIANLDNNFGDSISISKLLAVKQLSLSYVPSLDFNLITDVAGFTLLRISKTNERSEIKNFSAVFSNEIKNLIKSCTTGDILIFKNITADGPEPGILKIRDMVFYIK